jgi:hypothetical protein
MSSEEMEQGWSFSAKTLLVLDLAFLLAPKVLGSQNPFMLLEIIEDPKELL